MLTAVTLLVMAVAAASPVPEAAASWGWSFELKGGVAGCSAVLVKNPNSPAGSATPANPWLLTAFHCLEKNTPAEATNRSGQTIRLECDAKRGAGPPCGAYAFHLKGKDLSAIEVRPDMLARGTKLTPATIAAGSGQLYVFGWSAGFRRILVGTAPRAENCDDEKSIKFEVKGRLLYVTGSQCVNEGDSGGAVATNGGKVVGLVRAKDATRVDMIELIGASAKPVPAFLRAMFGPCANAGWAKEACVKALEGLMVASDSVANEAAGRGHTLLAEVHHHVETSAHADDAGGGCPRAIPAPAGEGAAGSRGGGERNASADRVGLAANRIRALTLDIVDLRESVELGPVHVDHSLAGVVARMNNNQVVSRCRVNSRSAAPEAG